MEDQTKEALKAIKTLQKYQKYLKNNSLPDSRIENMRIQILDELDEIDYCKINRLMNNLSHSTVSRTKTEINEPFQCPCPFGTYPLEDLMRWKEEAIKSGNLHCARILEEKIRDYKPSV